MIALRLIFTGLRLLTVTVLALAMTTCTARPGLLEQAQTLGAIRIATVNSAMTYYLDADGATGFEYDLSRAFADELGLNLDIQVLPDRQAVLDAVASGKAHIGVGLAVSEARRERVRFTPPYAAIKLQAVYRARRDKPEALADLSGGLVLPADTALADWLDHTHPELTFTVDPNANSEELMDRVASGDVDVTVANADIVAMNQRYYPNLRVGFTLPDVRQRVAWAFNPKPRAGIDDALYNRAIAFLERTKNDGRMRILRDRYFGHVDRLGFVGGHEFARQVERRLDRWRGYFKKAARKYDIDWRLLAAIGYQESHWDKDAVSPTTVRGIMMLTLAAAKDVDVDDRRDPQQSIDGGAQYFVRMYERLPYDIKPPDRTWFALAAYNIGYGHVMDARRLLATRGRDPNLWVNLRDALPWLTQDRYLSETRYGYARGLEAQAYVGNIRAYYDILVWMHSANDQTGTPDALSEEQSKGGADVATPPAGGIDIDSPAF